MGLAYAVVGKIGLSLDAVAGFATLVWPPTGLSLAALLGLDASLWPGVVLGAFAVNLWTGASVPVALGIAAGNTLEAVLGAALIRRTVGRDPFQGMRGVWAFLLFGVIASPAISAAIGVACLWGGSVISTVQARPALGAWWLGDALGALVVAPVLLLAGNRGGRLTGGVAAERTARAPRIVEASVLALTIVALAGLVFGLSNLVDWPREFLLFPP